MNADVIINLNDCTYQETFYNIENMILKCGWNRKEEDIMITKKDIFQFLENLEIKHNDKVTIHCSLKSIGEIENGADGFIDAFCEYLSEGLFIVPTHTWDKVDKEHPFYDVKTTEPCVGVLSKVAAFRPDGVRSLHPTHSVTVFGKNAMKFVEGEEKCGSPSPIGSCINRLYEENGKILLIGVGHERNTYLHAVDERLNIPDRLTSEGFEIQIKDYDGNIITSPPFHTHFTSTIDTCVSDYYPNYKELFEYVGAVTYSQLGEALVYCCNARKMTDALQRIWEHTDNDLCITHRQIPEDLYR